MCLVVALFVAVASLSCFPENGNSLKMAKDFEYILYDQTESKIHLSDSYGAPIILNFWAGLCPPCRAEMPDFQQFYEDHGHQIVILGIDIGKYTGLGSRKDALKLVDELGVTYTIGGVGDDSVIELYGVYGLPHTVFIDADQNVTRAWSGAINLSKLEEIGLSMLESAE